MPVPLLEIERTKRKKLENDMIQLKRKYKTLQQKLRRKNRKIESMKDVINEIKNRKWISETNASNLEDQFSGITKEVIQNQLRNNGKGATGRRYSEEFKQFALTVYFYSPKAYNFLRKVFFLPHQSSIRNWTSSVNCEPGFLSEALADLQRQSEENVDMSECALILDGMSIRKQILYCQRLAKYVGFTDYGNLVPEGAETPASEALVFMLVGLKSRWKCPVGYFLIDKTDAETQASLVKQCLSLASDNGLSIRSVTCDGTNTNVKTLKLLGCKFGKDFDAFVPTFKHPSRDYLVYGIPDACHMLKNARNCLGNLKILKNASGEEIKWEYISRLHELQLREGFNLCNKLNSTHIHWSTCKMKVKVAAQTLSSSVADALEFLEKSARLPEFQGCGPTIKFIRHIDMLFDILNSRHRLQTGYKQPLTRNNIDYREKSLKEISTYLLTLTNEKGQKIIQHRRKAFVQGFVSAAKAVVDLARDLLFREVNPFGYLLTYKVSQDHIELLFCCIRDRGGFNNNPNVVQFKAAMRQILIKNSIIVTSAGNCLSFESKSIGSLFSLKWSKRRTPFIDQVQSGESNGMASDAEQQLINQLLEDVNISSLQENVLYYISGWILRKIIDSVDCHECAESLMKESTGTGTQRTGYSYESLVTSKDRGGLFYSSYAVHKLVVSCERAFQIHVANNPSKISTGSKLEHKIMMDVLKSQDWSRYFPVISDHGFHVDIIFEDDHLTQILKQVCHRYLNMRLHTYAKRYTREIVNDKKPSVRRVLTKLILFKNN